MAEQRKSEKQYWKLQDKQIKNNWNRKNAEKMTEKRKSVIF